ncbi:MAG: 4-(cytidine 5'-diphospho)-2-C-methyl-D-erythritol kinase [Thermoguttaceae bacterium]|jgi:4-diphosphocytidyl-2-C-methyl-D-erythritol kinase|nr:4-(cytidine 5'-diphospho)-2-C-methyl-D-erythritol kinase [Thermoguttaceae bacterium]
MKIEVIEEGRRWRVWAPAKINLFFEILGKRPDGFHEIETVVSQMDLYDRLEFERTSTPGLRLECYDEEGNLAPEIPCDERNLVAKAYLAFFSEYSGCANFSGIKCRLYKKIPTKSGLGGGSTDAAASLAVFNMAAETRLSKERLQQIAGRVGSDVALFLEEGGSIGRGRGELVEPFETPSLSLVLLKPQEGLSTPAVYERYASTAGGEEKKSLDEFCKRVSHACELADTSNERSTAAKIIAENLFNRLEQPAADLWNGFERRRKLLLSTGALGVQMSGSGTAFFAVYPDELSAIRASRLLPKSPGSVAGDLVYVVKTL